ncbi:hypothetical protein O206_21310 [Ochrobactrum sp. EGD-AQ16]|nr:hypothetical protein O206_21310 [Ochrobactrum sp. EGD-AQ16]
MLKRCRLSPRKRTDTSPVRKSRRRDEYGHHALYAVRLEGRKVSKVEVKALAKSKAMDIYRENYFRRLSASIRTASSVAPLFGLF